MRQFFRIMRGAGRQHERAGLRPAGRGPHRDGRPAGEPRTGGGGGAGGPGTGTPSAAPGGRNDLEIDVDPELPLVTADRRRIVQVLVNLLTNAARHSPGVVGHPGDRRQGGSVRCRVGDPMQEGAFPPSGCPTCSASSRWPTPRRRAGTPGLGLAICQGIVEAHGGRIRAESDGVGLGARFNPHPARGGDERMSGGVSPVPAPLVTRGTPREFDELGAGAAGGGRRPQRPALRPRHPGRRRVTRRWSPGTPRKRSAPDGDRRSPIWRSWT